MAYVQRNNPFKLVKRGREKHARSIRKGVGHVNKEGKTETHKMAYGSGEVDGKTVYRAYPTITFDDKGKSAFDAQEKYELGCKNPRCPQHNYPNLTASRAYL